VLFAVAELLVLVPAGNVSGGCICRSISVKANVVVSECSVC